MNRLTVLFIAFIVFIVFGALWFTVPSEEDHERRYARWATDLVREIGGSDATLARSLVKIHEHYAVHSWHVLYSLSRTPVDDHGHVVTFGIAGRVWAIDRFDRDELIRLTREELDREHEQVLEEQRRERERQQRELDRARVARERAREAEEERKERIAAEKAERPRKAKAAKKMFDRLYAVYDSLVAAGTHPVTAAQEAPEIIGHPEWELQPYEWDGVWQRPSLRRKK